MTLNEAIAALERALGIPVKREVQARVRPLAARGGRVRLLVTARAEPRTPRSGSVSVTAALRRLPLVLIYLGGILWLSATPARDLARLRLSASTLDLVHIPLFVGLTWVTLWSLGGPPGVRVALAACLGFAAVAEWLQASVPGRVASLADLRANAAGVLIGIAVFEGVLLWARKRERL